MFQIFRKLSEKTLCKKIHCLPGANGRDFILKVVKLKEKSAGTEN